MEALDLFFGKDGVVIGTSSDDIYVMLFSEVSLFFLFLLLLPSVRVGLWVVFSCLSLVLLFSFWCSIL